MEGSPLGNTQLRNKGGGRTMKNEKNLDRYLRYYDDTNLTKKLYNKETKHNRLTRLLFTENNIMLALKRISYNEGRNTPGVDGKTFDMVKHESYIQMKNELILLWKTSCHVIKYMEIPKNNGEVRILGVGNIYYRILQQCIVNILEPITESKFLPTSFGFRRDISTKDCIGYISKKLNISHGKRVKCAIWDVDFKDCFNNIPQQLVLKYLKIHFNVWDKGFLIGLERVLTTRYYKNGKLLERSNIGLPQGGVLSPLLANVYLHDLDLTINKMYHPINLRYEGDYWRNRRTLSSKESYPVLRQKHGIPVEIIRFADDFLIWCKTKDDLDIIKQVVNRWCTTNGMTINQEKTKTHILNRNSKCLKLEFIGFEIKVNKMGKQMFSIRNPKLFWNEFKNKLRKYLRMGQKNKAVAYITSIFASYDICTNLKWICNRINYILYKQGKYNRGSTTTEKVYKKDAYILKGGIEARNVEVNVWDIRQRFNKSVKDYSIKKNKYWNPNISIDERGMIEIWCNKFIEYQKKQPVPNGLLMYLHGLAIIQKKSPLFNIPIYNIHPSHIEIHHKKPLSKGGTNSFNNLLICTKFEHSLIHNKSKTQDVEILRKLRLIQAKM